MMVTILPQEVGGGACSHLGGSREHFWKQAGLHSYWPTLPYVPHPKDSTTAPKVWPAVGSKCSRVRARTPHSCGETFVINYSWMNIQISKPYTSHNTVKEKEVVRRNKEEKQRKNKEGKQAWQRFKESDIFWLENQQIFPGSSEYCSFKIISE